MKTAEEFQIEISKLWVKYDSGDIDTNEFENKTTDLFKQAQKDAYNHAIEDTVTLIENHDEETYLGVFEDVLKLKKK